MTKFLSLFMSFITMVCSAFGINMKTPLLPQETAENFEAVLRFMVCSDTHIKGWDDTKLERIKNAVGYAYGVADADESYNGLDAVMFVGDLTDDGTDEQFRAFESTVKSSVKDGTNILAVVAKNHDGYDQGKKNIEYCNEITGNGSDFHVVINGFHFIGISTSKNEGVNYMPYQRIWLEKQLKQAAEDDPEKPIFICHHEHVRSTVYGSSLYDGWGISYFKDIFVRYPQIVHFSGHSHYPLNDPRSIWQGAFTSVGTGAMHYMEFTVDADRTVHPENNGNAAQCWIVETDKDNRVRLQGIDVLTQNVLCEYLIEKPSDISTFNYTPSNQKAHSSAPVFGEDAQITAQDIGNGKYTVTVPAAQSTDGRIVFLYRVSVVNNMGITVHREYKLNNYWTTDTYENISFTLDAKPGYTVSITAENAYGMKTDALCVKL